MKEKDPVNRYSMAFKMQVVKDVENGHLNPEKCASILNIVNEQPTSM